MSQRAQSRRGLAGNPAMKQIDYRGGILSFRIPAVWVEEYRNDHAMFYEDGAERGTLRLTLITVERATNSPDPVTIRNLVAFMRDLTKQNNPEVLENGNVLCRYTREAREDGEPILVHYWGDWQSSWIEPWTTCHFFVRAFR